MRSLTGLGAGMMAMTLATMPTGPGFYMPTDPINHVVTPKPISKRKARRQRGKASA